MSDPSNEVISRNEILKQTAELWKTTVGTQQHFNTLQLQLRNFALTLFLAVLAAAALAIKEHLRIKFFGLNTSTALLACLAGLVVIFSFYYMDWGYHQLLKGAVAHGEKIEAQLKEFLPEAGLALSITQASKAKRFLWLFSTSSTRRLHIFYWLLLGALLITAVFAHHVVSQDTTSPTVVNARTALRRYYESGKYQRDVAQASDLGRRLLREQLDRPNVGNAKPAIVFDIDETLLSTWPILKEGDFGWDEARYERFVNDAKAEALSPVQSLYQYALQEGVKVFIVTSRSEKMRSTTERNLAAAGFQGPHEILMRTNQTEKSAELKARLVQRIPALGFKVLMSVGDQNGDINSTPSAIPLLIPNPFYTND